MQTREHQGHKFSVSVKTGQSYAPSKTTFGRLSNITGDNGYVYVQLVTPENKKTSYFYDNKSSRQNRLIKVFATAIGTMGLGMITTSLTDNKFVIFPVVLAQLVAPLAVGTTGRGVVRRKVEKVRSDISVTFKVTPVEYYALSKELRALAKKESHGTYSYFFNNCACFAVRFGKMHGYDLPKPAFPTPVTLLSALEAEYKKQGALKAPSPITG